MTTIYILNHIPREFKVNKRQIIIKDAKLKIYIIVFCIL